MTRHQEYAKQLILTHGHEKALEIVERALAGTARYGYSLTLFDEADFHVNDFGRYEYSKTQSKKTQGRKEKRVKSNLNFFNLVKQLIKKEVKNARKN